MADRVGGPLVGMEKLNIRHAEERGQARAASLHRRADLCLDTAAGAVVGFVRGARLELRRMRWSGRGVWVLFLSFCILAGLSHNLDEKRAGCIEYQRRTYRHTAFRG